MSNDTFIRLKPPSAPSKRPGIEARRVPRRVFSRPIGLMRHGDYQVVQALQLSEGGMLIQTTTEQAKLGYKVGDTIVATLIIPGGRAVVTRGEIIYTRPGSNTGELQFGIRFQPLAIQQRRFVRIYVTAKTQAEAEAEVNFDS